MGRGCGAAMRRRTSLVGIAMLFAFLVSGPAHADEIYDYVGFNGNHWVAFKFNVGQNASIEAAVQATHARAAGLASAVYLIGDGRISGGAYVSWSGANYLHSDLTGDIVSRQYVESGWSVTGVRADGLTAGEYTLLMIVAATEGKDGAAWIGGKDLEVTERTSGSRAFFYLPNDFGGTISASLAFPTLAVGGQVSMPIKHGLWGEFSGTGNPCRVHVDGPDGRHEGGAGFQMGRAGDYTFANDVCVDLLGGGPILWGADVELP